MLYIKPSELLCSEHVKDMLLDHKSDCPKHIAHLQHYPQELNGKLTTIYRVICPNCLVVRPIDIQEWNSIDRLAVGMNLMNDVTPPIVS